jgi:predicted enzyme related to lactoylglutathione lyase
MGQPVAMFEITARDTGKATRFYSELFDWTAQPIGDGYAIVHTGAGEGAIPGGIGEPQRGDVPRTTVYVRVDDLQACLDKASELGGSTIVPPTPLPGDAGSFAVFADPEGTPVGLWA